MDDILIGAPLFMEREFESNPREVGQVYLYLQVSALVFRDPQVLAGTEVFGRFGTAVAHLGDLNQDGYNGKLHQCMEIPYGAMRSCYCSVKKTDLTMVGVVQFSGLVLKIQNLKAASTLFRFGD